MTHDPVVVYMVCCLCLSAVLYAVGCMVVLRDRGEINEDNR